MPLPKTVQNSSSTRTEEDDGPDWLVGVASLVVGVAWCLWLWFGAYAHNQAVLEPKILEQAGQLGDWFGSLNALFTALAFVAVWWTGRMQQRELRLQRKEFVLQRDALELQRAELTDTRAELKRTADAQELQIRQAALSSERQLRAYVNIEFITCQTHRNSGMAICILMKNYGQTPAYDLAIGAASRIGTLSDDARDVRPGLPVGVLAPSAEYRYVFTQSVLDPEFLLLESGGAMALLNGSISYRDAFGVDRTTLFNVHCPGGSNTGSIQYMSSRSNGNQSN